MSYLAKQLEKGTGMLKNDMSFVDLMLMINYVNGNVMIEIHSSLCLTRSVIYDNLCDV